MEEPAERLADRSNEENRFGSPIGSTISNGNFSIGNAARQFRRLKKTRTLSRETIRELRFSSHFIGERSSTKVLPRRRKSLFNLRKDSIFKTHSMAKRSTHLESHLADFSDC